MERINNINFLSEEDKNILRNAFSLGNINLTREMSIFSKKGNYHQNENYVYFETDFDEDIYYISLYTGQDLGIFFDNEKKILFNSRYYFICSFNVFIANIQKSLICLKNINIENFIDIGTNYVAIQKWFLTYGHFKDELFCLSDFISDSQYHGIIDFHTDNDVFKHIQYNENYTKLAKIIFKDSYVNPYKYKGQLLKLKNLKLVQWKITDKMFHSFPKSTTNKILDSISNFNEVNNKIFVTRGKAIHLPRNLSNQGEIEDYFSENGIFCLNPEEITLEELIVNIRNCNDIIITWGSSLVNMVYLKPGTNVTILKSKSYMHESIELFRKLINTYELNVRIIECDSENVISLDKLEFLL